MTEDEALIESAMRRTAAGGWLLISFGGTVVLVLLAELAMIVVIGLVVGVIVWNDPSSPWNSGSGAALPPQGTMLMFGGMFGVFALLQVLQVVLAAVVAFGGYNLLRLRSQRWAMTGAVTCIVAVLFVSMAQLCYSWVGLLAAVLLFPLGIVAAVIALVAIGDQRVKDGFDAQARLSGRA